MKKLFIITLSILGLYSISQGASWDKYKFNPFTSKLDYYQDVNIWASTSTFSNIASTTTSAGAMLYFSTTTYKWTPESTSNLFWDATNKRLGIGTASPRGLLEIFCTGTTYGLVIEPASSYELYFAGGGSKNANIYSEGHQYWLAAAGKDLYFGSNGTNQQLNLVAGSVGINTTTPRRKLDVLDASNPQIRWSHTDNSIYGEMQINASGITTLTTTGNSFVFGTTDSVKTKWGAGSDFSAYYTGSVAVLKSNEVAASDLVVETGAGKTLKLNNAVWEDLTFPATLVKLGATSKPDFDYTNVGLLFPQNDASEKIYISAQMPHSWSTGTVISPHIHFIPPSTSTPTFKMDYAIYNIGSSTKTFTTIATSSATCTAYKHTIFDFQDIDMTGYGISCQMDIIIYRDDNNVTGDVLVKEFDIHYQRDTMGSRTEYTK